MDANSALQYGNSASAALNQYQGVMKQQQAAMQPGVDKFNATVAQPKPEVPEQAQVPKAPQQEDFQKTSAGWLNAMAVLAAISGSRSRQHATTALSAFAAGVKGLKQGQQQAFDNAYKTWEGNTKATLDNNKMLMDKYKAVMDDRSLSEQEAQMQIKMIAAEFHDPLMLAADNWGHQMAIVDARNKAEFELGIYDKKLQMQKQIWDEKEKVKQGEKNQPSIDQSTADFAADQLLAGDKSGLSNYGRGTAATANLTLIHQTVQKRAEEKGITGDQLAKINAQFAGATSEARAIGTASGKIELAANSLDESLPLLEDAIKNVDLSQFPDMNALENYAREHSGDPKITTLNTALQTTVSDYSTLIARNGQRTDATDAAAKHLANVNMSNGQLHAFIAQVRREKEAQLRATKKTKEGSESSSGNAGAPAGGSAPEGTIIHDAQGNTKVKKDGKWVDQ